LGQYNLAQSEIESLRKEAASSPLNTYRLMNTFYSLGLYRPAILACRDLLDMAGLDDLSSLSVPIYFTHIRFGAYFRPLVVASANEEGIHPLILYALLRQESLFDPYIVSSAGARGMAQFMPATAKETADLLGWPAGYAINDLNRPVVAVKFAASYLSRMQRYLNGDLFAALAAYNGGPGNAEVWKALAQNDPDLMVEVVRAEETQTYLKQVMEFLNIYKLVYSHPE
jgi:soluble lytic murein transglycosylase